MKLAALFYVMSSVLKHLNRVVVDLANRDFVFLTAGILLNLLILFESRRPASFSRIRPSAACSSLLASVQ